MTRKPMVLTIVDGWGLAPPWGGNAVTVAKTPFINQLWQHAPTAILEASEKAVGLPVGECGNSEVGHLNIGSGQVVHQDLPSISGTIEDGTFFNNKVLNEAFDYVKKKNKQMHLIGLLSDGGTHSHIAHLFALLDMAKKKNVEKVIIHVFTDGRDTSPMEALHYMSILENKIREAGCGIIGSISGRYYAMDREDHWERIEMAYRVLTEGVGSENLSAMGAVSEAYRNGQSDEFIIPTVVRAKDQMKHFIQDEDAIIFYNFRADRARELTQALVKPEFDGFKRVVVRKNLNFVTFTSYQEGLPVKIAFPPEKVEMPLAQILSQAGWKQLHIAETAKYPHVTYFFNGGIEEPFPGEDRVMVPSPKVDKYEQWPQMSALQVTDEIIKRLGKYDFIVVNYANLDMVGHSGNIRAAVRSVEVIDECLKKLKKAVDKINGTMIITADHGNAEQMVNPETGGADTGHTTNPVPFFLLGKSRYNELKKHGVLADIAPTILDYVGLPIPKVMTGKSLLIKS